MLTSKINIFTFVLAVASFTVLSSCGNDSGSTTDSTTEVPVEMTLEAKVDKFLHQHWTTKMASRNGKATKTLEGFFLDFSARDSMITNLLGEPQKYPYKMSKDKIIQEGPQPLEFNIIELEENNLVLKMNMRNTDFEFVMAKADEPDPIL